MAFQQYNIYPCLTPAKLVAISNQSGTYYNGPANNGVNATFTYATGALTIDSVAVNVGDRVVFQAQTNGWENGIYICNQAGATGVAAILQRAADFQNIEQMKEGQFCTISEGTVNAGAIMVLNGPLPAAIGVNNIVFTSAIPAGLGTASTKAASDNTKASVASVSGATTSGNIPAFNDTAGTLTNGPVAANKVLTSAIATPDVGPNLVSFDVTVGQAALAAGGSVILVDSSGSKQYRVRSLQLNSGGTNFSGGGGDRLGQVTDGTTVYSVIPAANMQTLANAQWGATALPNPASAAIFTPTAAGVDLVFKYSGGTTDYTAGSLRISGLAERIA